MRRAFSRAVVARIPTILRSSIALYQFSVSLISDVSVLCLFRYAVRFLLNLGSIYYAVTCWPSVFSNTSSQAGSSVTGM